jgi:chromosome segregation ATPase
MTRKLDKEHLEQIQKLREQFSQITSTIGSITIEEIVLKRQLDKLQQEQERFLNQLDALQTQESELIEKMRERYGEGQINVADGTFTPDAGLAK